MNDAQAKALLDAEGEAGLPAATGTTDPMLAARARNEQRRLADILDRHDHLAILSWQATLPAGSDALAQLIRPAAPAGTTSGPTER